MPGDPFLLDGKSICIAKLFNTARQLMVFFSELLNRSSFRNMSFSLCRPFSISQRFSIAWHIRSLLLLFDMKNMVILFFDEWAPEIIFINVLRPVKPSVAYPLGSVRISKVLLALFIMAAFERSLSNFAAISSFNREWLSFTGRT